MKDQAKKPGIGVVVGRFQVHKLTEGHLDLFNDVFERHEKVLVFLGTSPIKASRNNPLPFKARQLMLHEYFPADKLIVQEIKDVNNEVNWSKNLDKMISEYITKHCPGENATLYGSRDGFIPYYRGTYPTIELPARRVNVSGSIVREEISKGKLLSNADFRQGYIYACFDRYATSYTTVDAVILDRSKQIKDSTLPLGTGIRILLGHKPNDAVDHWRTVGGFVDINLDASCEEAVKREGLEETKLKMGQPIYIGTARIPYWRYKNEQDGIMSIIFEINDFVGKAKASDDISDLKWFDLDLVLEGKVKAVPEHEVIINLIKAHLQREQNQKENRP